MSFGKFAHVEMEMTTEENMVDTDRCSCYLQLSHRQSRGVGRGGMRKAHGEGSVVAPHDS